MKNLIIVGAGGFAREVLWLIQEKNKSQEAEITVHGFIGESSATRLNGLPVLGNDAWAFQQVDRKVRFVVAIGDPDLRQKVAKNYVEQGFRPMRLVHPGVHLGEDVRVGAGTILCAGAVLTTDIEVGEFSIVNLNATVGHDCTLGAFTTLHPGVNVSGNVRVGEGAELGAGATVLPGIQIGAGAVLGAGAVATADLEAGKRYVGVPARIIEDE